MFYSTSSIASPIECAYPVIKETIPRSHLGYSTNNLYEGFPPLMSDGRSITASYQPTSVVNASFRQQNHIQSNWEYRQFLQKNGQVLLKQNFLEASNDCGYFQRNVNVNMPRPPNRPYVHKDLAENPEDIPFYKKSDLKELYLTREQLDSMKTAPVLTTLPMNVKPYNN